MKKLILLAALVFIQVAAIAEPAANKSAEAASNFTNPNNVFMIVGIVLVASFVLIPVYSMSRAVKVLAKKAAEK